MQKMDTVYLIRTALVDGSQWSLMRDSLLIFVSLSQVGSDF